MFEETYSKLVTKLEDYIKQILNNSSNKEQVDLICKSALYDIGQANNEMDNILTEMADSYKEEEEKKHEEYMREHTGRHVISDDDGLPF